MCFVFPWCLPVLPTNMKPRRNCYCCFLMLLFPSVPCFSVLVNSYNIRSGFFAASRNSSFRTQNPYQRNGCRKPQGMSVSPRLSVSELGRGVAHSGACKGQASEVEHLLFSLWHWQVQVQTGMEEERRRLIVQRSRWNHWSRFLLPWPLAPFQLLWDAGAV